MLLLLLPGLPGKTGVPAPRFFDAVAVAITEERSGGRGSRVATMETQQLSMLVWAFAKDNGGRKKVACTAE